MDDNCSKNLIMWMTPHIKKLHTLDPLLTNHISSCTIKLQKHLFPLSTRQHHNDLFPWFTKCHTIRCNHPKGKSCLLPWSIFFSLWIDNESIFIFNCGTEYSKMQHFSNMYFKCGIHHTVDQEGMYFAQGCLTQQKFIHFQIMRRLINLFKSRVPNHKFVTIGNTIVLQFFLQRTLHIQDSNHTRPHLNGCRSMHMRMIPIHPTWMMIWHMEFITITFPRLDSNMWSIRMMRPHRIKHMNLHI
mmetsp:Transcript_12787/g.23999  ORF Transcript_12787/g.23999 Transcript_12787/m.23999 type:complete len:243 (+) Transcript_12787:872-1600(+)